MSTMSNDECPDSEWGHSWIVGMMYVHNDDLESVATRRRVECERCEYVYQPKGVRL